MLGLLPVPGPFDEVVLLLVGAILWVFYRDQISEAWQRAERRQLASPAARPS
jgi:hypothetical protein